MIVTIDGPAASGKSSVARLLADELDFYYLYTGLLYRGLAYILVTHYHYNEKTIVSPDKDDIVDITQTHRFQYNYSDGQARIFFDNIDITSHLKTAEVDKWSSMVSSHDYVRDAVLERQVKIGNQYDIIAEGRDTGTVVFPHADYKFFLTASQEVRAKRWQSDQKKRGTDYTIEQSLQAIVDRDKRDQDRIISPLVQANNAILIDNSDLGIQETVEKIKAYIR